MSRSLNPYIAGNPVGNSNAFTGRADIVREVLHIFSRPEENAIVLYGQRRIGKTSVLQFLKKTLAQETVTGHYFPVYFDLQDKATFSLGDVLKDLANTIANELGFPSPQLGDNPEHSFQYEWLPEQLAKLAKGAALVLLLDEFDVLAAESAKGAGADFFPYLRKLIASDRQRLNFVFVIGRNVSDLNTIALSLFKSVPTRRISLLGKEDTFDLIRLAEKTSPLRWRADALERIWQLTNGHAFFTQQLCSFAWEEAYDDGDFTSEEIGADIVDSVIDDALSASRNAFEWLWDGLPPAERVVSAALAQAGGRSVTETELEKLLHESGVRIVIRELQDAPKLLQEWDLLEPVEGGFRFRVELLRRWIAENKPLRRVQDELDRIEPVAESLFQAAQGLYKNSQLESAENLLRQAIGLNPNHVKANKLLADLLLASGNYADAKTLLASLYEYQPTEARSRLIQAWLGIVSKANTDDDKLACYEEIFRLDANQTEAKKAYKAIWKLKGDYALEQGLTADALEAYKKAGQDKKVAQLKQDIRKSEAKKQLAVLESLKKEKKYTEAFELIKNLETNFSEFLDWSNEKQRIEQLITITANYQQALDALQLGKNKQAQELLVKVIYVNAEFEEAARYLCLAVTGNDYKILKDNLNTMMRRNRNLTSEIDFLESKNLYSFISDFFSINWILSPSTKFVLSGIFLSISPYLFYYKFGVFGILLGVLILGLAISLIYELYDSDIDLISTISGVIASIGASTLFFTAAYQYIDIVAAKGTFGINSVLLVVVAVLIIIYNYCLCISTSMLLFISSLCISISFIIFTLLNTDLIMLVIFFLWLIFIFTLYILCNENENENESESVEKLLFCIITIGILLISLTNVYLLHNVFGMIGVLFSVVFGITLFTTAIFQMKKHEFATPHKSIVLLLFSLGIFLCYDTSRQVWFDL